MASSWQIMESGTLPAHVIMAKDETFLQNLNPHSPPILHFYEWATPCLTHGYFTDPNHHLNLVEVEKLGLSIARRPTGGGIIFHLTDFAFSLIIPASHPRFSLNTLKNYACINSKVAEAITQFSNQSMKPYLLQEEELSIKQSCSPFCMALPTCYDLILERKKVGGAAQRRTKKGLLHQATLSLQFPPLDILGSIFKNQTMMNAMQENTFCLAPNQPLAEARKNIKFVLKKIISSL